MAKYQRVLLKISGEALSGENDFGIDTKVLKYLAAEIKPLLKLKVELGIIIGGGNLFRGANLKEYNRIEADQMGMLATVINALALRDIFENNQVPCEILSSIAIPGIVKKYQRREALSLLHAGKVLILAAGTGNPLVTTDTALALRGVELDAEILLKATNVDGVYSADPKKDAKATLYTKLSYQEVIQKELKVMDLIAFSMCRDHGMKLRVFNLRQSGALLDIVAGKEVGTEVS